MRRVQQHGSWGSTAIDYPTWTYYPLSEKPPMWARELVGAVAAAREQIESAKIENLTSNIVLSHLAPRLSLLKYTVETGKSTVQKIRRPVLFGANGKERVAYEVDAFHDELGIAVEVEAGRGARGNAIYRDLIRTSLIVGAEYLALGVMIEYRHFNNGKLQRVSSYEDARAQIDAIYTSGRLRFPFRGLLLFGY
jgi:hypothetical protein